MAETLTQPAPAAASKPITLMYVHEQGVTIRKLTLSSPVGLKEAALDSPTYRSGFTHFAEQIDLVERWLESYVKSITKLSYEIAPFENLINGYLTQSTPPAYFSEAILDHDYTLLAMKRYSEGAKEFWTAAFTGVKKMEANMLEPINAFLQNDLRMFKDARKAVDQSQKQLDILLSRYSGLAKTKEASSLREDAFQVHEARKSYLKASMDFSVIAPQLRMALDKMLVKMFSDQWRDTRSSRQLGTLEKWTGDIERVRGWSREMENGERTFRRELQQARQQIEESAEAAIRPSRELDDYSLDATHKSRGPSTANLQTFGLRSRPARAEKQGWLNLRTVSGKPSRTVWLRRWFYVKSGIFGWLVQGSRSGAVEESERIGVLLCSVRASNSDDRRHVFEVKTKDTTIILQAETQPELNDWLVAFDTAKQKALEDPSGSESSGNESRAKDLAFAISPPSAPEFAASTADSGMPQSGDETSALTVDRSSTLPIPGIDHTGARNSFDVSSPKKSTFEKEIEGTREKLMHKLDLHRKPLASGPGGIASLIAASHGSMPVGPGALPSPTPDTPSMRKISTSLPIPRDLPTSTLAPSTLANPPAPTNLSATAVIVNGEQSVGMGRADASGGIPSGLMANVWGSSNWGYLNRLERGELDQSGLLSKISNSSSLAAQVTKIDDSTNTSPENTTAPAQHPSTSPSHRKTVSLDRDVNVSPAVPQDIPEYPVDYPVQLRTQDAQFRLLFPDAGRDEKVVLVFKASWNPNDQQDFPGRVYVTANEVYFYSNYCGMTMTTSIRLDFISDVTGAGGRDCDFLYLHLKNESPSGFTRVTVKTFLEPLRLLQRRLSLLITNAVDKKFNLDDLLKALIKLEQDDAGSSPSLDDWENVSISTPVDGSSTPRRRRSLKDHRDLRANVLIDRGLYGDSKQLGESSKTQSKSFKLPKQPVIFVPFAMDRLVVEKEYEISPKALFHVLFGDKSAVWQLLYHERQAQHIRMGPWTQPVQGHLRRDFEYEIEYLDLFRRACKAKISDHQVIDLANEHLLYVVSDRKTPWHLPYRDDFTLLTKVVITHVAKSKCKLALFIKVDWTKSHALQPIISRRALNDLYHDALDLADVVSDQCRRLGEGARTKKAISVFGPVGVQTQVTEFAGSESPLSARLGRSMKPRALTSLVFESCASMAESVLTSAFQIIFRICRWVWKTISANGIILCILAFSILANLVFSSRNATDSWRERRAANFMARLGVGPDLAMSKNIFLHDLTEATTPSTSFAAEHDESQYSQCRSTFDDLVSGSSHGQTSGHSIPSSKVRSTSVAFPLETQSQEHQKHQIRLQRTRQTLASQRHDLIIGLRIVNRIEQEMLRAEWEDWVLGESGRCQQVDAWIQRSRKEQRKQNDGSSTNAAVDDVTRKTAKEQSSWSADSSRLQHIEEWYEGYCLSCLEERKALEL